MFGRVSVGRLEADVTSLRVSSSLGVESWEWVWMEELKLGELGAVVAGYFLLGILTSRWDASRKADAFDQ